MSTKEQRERIELLQGTLDLLILRTLLRGPVHGHAIAKAIEFDSDDVLQVEQGSLYPALHRLIKRGWISSEEGTSENNRRAKFYRLTPKGRLARFGSAECSLCNMIGGSELIKWPMRTLTPFSERRSSSRTSLNARCARCAPT
jgi:PadR family transcriptional regulator PadR